MPVLNILGLGGISTPPPAAFEPSVVTSGGGAYFNANDKTSIFSAALDDSGNFDPAAGTAAGGILDKSEMGGMTAAAFIASQPNLVSNGSFDTDTGWTETDCLITGGACEFDGTASAHCDQSGVTDTNGWYYIKLTIANYVSGSLRVDNGDNAPTNYGCQADGVHEFLTYTTAGSGSGNIQIEANSSTGYVGDVTDIEIKLLPGNHAYGEGAGNVITVEVDGNGKYYLKFDDNSDFKQRIDFTWKDDMVAAFAYEPVGSTFTTYSSALSYGAGVNWSFGQTSSASTHTPSMFTTGVTNAWSHDTAFTDLTLVEIVFDNVAHTFDVVIDTTTEATGETLGGGSALSSLGRLRLGVSQSGGANELPCAWYGAVVYEASAINTDLRAWMNTEWSLGL